VEGRVAEVETAAVGVGNAHGKVLQSDRHLEMLQFAPLPFDDCRVIARASADGPAAEHECALSRGEFPRLVLHSNLSL
jgi:hypothetical protein